MLFISVLENRIPAYATKVSLDYNQSYNSQMLRKKSGQTLYRLEQFRVGIIPAFTLA